MKYLAIYLYIVGLIPAGVNITEDPNGANRWVQLLAIIAWPIYSPAIFLYAVIKVYSSEGVF